VYAGRVNTTPLKIFSGSLFKQTGKKKKGSGEGYFLPVCLSAEGGLRIFARRRRRRTTHFFRFLFFDWWIKLGKTMEKV